MVAPGLVRRAAPDVQAERAALENLIAIEPAQTPALDRLATLAVEAGDPARATALRRRQEEFLRDKERYRRLLIADPSPIPQDGLHERARLAERLGRWFEAQGWLTLALERNSADQAAREGLDRLAHPAGTKAPPTPPWTVLLDRPRGSDHPTAAATNDRARRGSPDPAERAGRPDRSSLAFRDDAQTAGLRFIYSNGQSPQHQIPETIGGGVAVLDYDDDGWLDVYLVQGGVFPPRSDRSGPESGDRLFHNRGDGTFEDVTERAGIADWPRVWLRRDDRRLRP